MRAWEKKLNGSSMILKKLTRQQEDPVLVETPDMRLPLGKRAQSIEGTFRSRIAPVSQV
jgi:hypothetical protein